MAKTFLDILAYIILVSFHSASAIQLNLDDHGDTAQADAPPTDSANRNQHRSNMQPVPWHTV